MTPIYIKTVYSFLSSTITIDDIFDATGVTDKTTLDGKDIVVKYTATLTDDAVPGTGYENTVTLTYSNDPNDSGSSSTKTGLTPPDKVIVFTNAQDFTKVDNIDNTKKLENAKFILYKGTGASKMYATLDSNGKVTGWVASDANATRGIKNMTYIISFIKTVSNSSKRFLTY